VEGVVVVSVGVVAGEVVLGADLLQILVGLRHLVDLLFLEVALEDDLLQNLLRVDLLFLGVAVEDDLLQILLRVVLLFLEVAVEGDLLQNQEVAVEDDPILDLLEVQMHRQILLLQIHQILRQNCLQVGENLREQVGWYQLGIVLPIVVLRGLEVQVVFQGYQVQAVLVWQVTLIVDFHLADFDHYLWHNKLHKC